MLVIFVIYVATIANSLIVAGRKSSGSVDFGRSIPFLEIDRICGLLAVHWVPTFNASSLKQKTRNNCPPHTPYNEEAPEQPWAWAWAAHSLPIYILYAKPRTRAQSKKRA